jgi:hypothetical protein
MCALPNYKYSLLIREFRSISNDLYNIFNTQMYLLFSHVSINLSLSKRWQLMKCSEDILLNTDMIA